MFKLKHALASAAAAAILTAGIAMAQGFPSLAGPAAPTSAVEVQTVVNGAKGYKIGYPVGWTVFNDEGLDYGLLSADGNIMCLVNSNAVDLQFTNAEAKAAMSQPLGEQFWTSNFFDGLANVKYIQTGADPNHPGGWPVQTVEATADITVDGQSIPATFGGITTFKTGAIFQAICFTPTQNYGAAKPFINAVLQSFKITKPD
jgi:hypothetical protein